MFLKGYSANISEIELIPNDGKLDLGNDDRNEEDNKNEIERHIKLKYKYGECLIKYPEVDSILEFVESASKPLIEGVLLKIGYSIINNNGNSSILVKAPLQKID